MATTFKNFLNNAVTNTRTLLHEAIPVTGGIVSGTYITNTETNIKNYAHGMFQSVYDYPFLSSSANHIFDITVGFSSSSPLSCSEPNLVTQQAKKINLYNQMAQILVGYNPTGSSIRGFDQDGNLAGGSSGLTSCFFLSFARLLSKDEVKKGSFSVTLYTGSEVGYPTGTANQLVIADHGAQNNYRVNSPAGEYAVLYTGSSDINSKSGVGLIYYQAGIAAITSSVFSSPGAMTTDIRDNPGVFVAKGELPRAGHSDIVSNYFGSAATASSTVWECFASQSISGAADGFRNRLANVSFNNTTELNSTIYFCRANHNEFNYSSNPTYLSSSKLVVKNNATDLPVSYITTIGLYSADNELLAMAKLSEPLKKDPNTELTLRVRLDY
jgi:hypothetical protein